VTGAPTRPMYAVYIVKRTQIYLDEDQAEALALRARSRGTTASHEIREAIDRYLAEPDAKGERLARFRDALDTAFGIAPDLPPGGEYVQSLREADSVRADELERRWRR
jgi:hypothetical protein